MGKYTALDDPKVDQFIDGHLERILNAITDRAAVQSVILYGSVARGEASVIVDGNNIVMLSDYEIKVVGESARLRRLCRDLSQQLTDELGVSTGLGWMNPRRFKTNAASNVSSRQAKPSIFMYELKSAGKVLHGEDVLKTGTPIRADDIVLESGLVLILNRLAESLPVLRCAASGNPADRFVSVFWINKVVLACAEALLVDARQYHYSYKERGQRIDNLLQGELAALAQSAPTMRADVARATEFKLRPDPRLYPDDLAGVWQQVACTVDVVFRHVVKQKYNLDFQAYTQFPALYLKALSQQGKTKSGVERFVRLALQKTLDSIRQVEQRRLPITIILKPFSAANVVYALVPVMFQSYFLADKTEALQTMKGYLELLEGELPPLPHEDMAWQHASQRLFQDWRVFCY